MTRFIPIDDVLAAVDAKHEPDWDHISPPPTGTARAENHVVRPRADVLDADERAAYESGEWLRP